MEATVSTCPACSTCDVVYFERGGAMVPKADVRVPVFHKETDPARPVCYCFDHSVQDVVAATRADGSNAIVESITAACRAGRERCEETSPQGRCCLGNVRAVAKAPLQAKPFPSCC